MKDLDGRGVPGAMVATRDFEEAAKAQGDAVGFMPAIVYVPAPIQNRTADELRAIAADAVEPILGAITAGAAED
jgi:hypothetical protein